MTVSKEQQSILAIVAGLLVAGWLLVNHWLYIAAGVVVLTFPFPVLHKPVHAGWMLIAETLGWISRHVILFLLFYLFLTPIAFFRRWLGGRPLITRRGDLRSTFSERSDSFSQKDFQNPW